ncbi:hypothetical protein AAVH_26181 [Aphelenchoides avenae]|nr:hypothetical protein AAVH_26181 [Aphelenchus avenae]
MLSVSDPQSIVVSSVMRVFLVFILAILVSTCVSHEPRERTCGWRLIKRVHALCNGCARGDVSKALLNACCTEGCTATFLRNNAGEICCDGPVDDVSAKDQEEPPRRTRLN